MMWQLHSDRNHVGNSSELYHHSAALLHLLKEPYQYSLDAQIKKPGDADVSLSNAVARDAIRRSCQAKLSYPAVVLTTGLYILLSNPSEGWMPLSMPHPRGSYHALPRQNNVFIEYRQ